MLAVVQFGQYTVILFFSFRRHGRMAWLVLNEFVARGICVTGMDVRVGAVPRQIFKTKPSGCS